MKTAFLTASISRQAGGVFESMRRLTQSLVADHDINVELLGLADEDTEKDLPLWDPIKPRVFEPRGPSAFGFAPGFHPTLQALDADIVHTQGLWMYPSVAGARWHRRCARPHVVSPHGMLDRWALAHSRWKKRLAGWLFENRHLRGATCLHALCQPEADAMRAYGLANPICVIPNGVDVPEETPPLPPPWREHIDPGSRVLLYLGRLHPKKGLPGLLRAWQVRRAGTGGESASWHLAVVGWAQGGHGEELKRLARELDLESSVHFIGALYGEAKTAAYQNADAFVLPSFSEGLPMAPLEAWSLSKPVLMTPACNLDIGFAEGAAISMTPDVPSIREALDRLMAATDEERRAMGRRGRELVMERFSWPRIAAEMKQVYEWVLGGGFQPCCVQMA